eukprot:6367421-Prymnesium_polylepis.3
MAEDGNVQIGGGIVDNAMRRGHDPLLLHDGAATDVVVTVRRRALARREVGWRAQSSQRNLVWQREGRRLDSVHDARRAGRDGPDNWKHQQEQSGARPGHGTLRPQPIAGCNQSIVTVNAREFDIHRRSLHRDDTSERHMHNLFPGSLTFMLDRSTECVSESMKVGEAVSSQNFFCFFVHYILIQHHHSTHARATRQGRSGCMRATPSDAHTPVRYVR